MEYKNVIAIDAMGGDNAPAEIIKGAIEAINERADIKLRLFGDKDKIETELNKYTYNKEQIGITHTTEEISCNEAPAMAIKKKKDSSLVVAIKSVKSGECDAIVSAGSSGAILVGGQVCKDGFYLYGGRCRCKESSCCYCKYWCRRGKR